MGTKNRMETADTLGTMLEGGDGKRQATKAVFITAPRIEEIAFTIRGTAAYVQHAFGAKAREAMKAAQEEGSTREKKRKREPKDFQRMYEEAQHVSTEGWLGIPAPSFRAALISACRMVGFAMTRAKLSLFVAADGTDRVDGTPLVRITKGEPRCVEHACRLESGVMDIHARPMWDPGWEAVVRVRFDREQFTAEDVANLLLRVGMQVGIGEGRPDSRKSAGMGWGTFELVTESEG